jgi:hypothetical protein
MFNGFEHTLHVIYELKRFFSHLGINSLNPRHGSIFEKN